MDSKAELSSNLSLDSNDNDHSSESFHDSDEETPSKFTESGLLSQSKSIQKKRTKYHRIDDNLRHELIDAVVRDGQMLKAAAKRFEINYSSAKSIYNTYKKEGRINKKAVRERNSKKQGNSRKSSEPTLQLSRQVSEKNSANLNSVKENFNYSILNDQKEGFPDKELHSLETPKDIKNLQLEAKQSLQNLILPSLEKTLRNHFQPSEPITMPNLNWLNCLLAQQQANTLQKYEELLRLQRTYSSPIPMLFSKPQMNILSPLPGFPYDQALNSHLGFRSLDIQNIYVPNGMPLMKGYQRLEQTQKQ